MKSLIHLNKLISYIFFIYVIIFKFTICVAAVDIWEKKENKAETLNQDNEEQDITIEGPTLSEDLNKVTIKINENEIEDSKKSVFGIFDPEKNNFNLNMWSGSNGDDIKKVLKRIEKIKLSKLSEDLLFKVLFTNAYPPQVNLSSKEFLKIKTNWLIKKNRVEDLELFLQTNPGVGQDPEVIKFLINEYISSANIKSACEKVSFIDQKVQNSYLEKFTIYCLINNDRKEEAQLVLDLLQERGFEDKFFENKINYLLGISEDSTQKIMDDNLLNFYFSHITSNDFQYEPNEKTDTYIWRYLSAANLIQIDNFENEDVILTYEQAAAKNSFDSNEIFKIYLKMDFNFNQLLNAQEIYKNLPNYKSRALIYQSILLSDDVEKKISLALLLKDLFIKDKIFSVYSDELSSILRSINTDEISEDYSDLIKKNLEEDLSKKVKFDNEVIHKSKIIKHFLDNNEKLSRTEKDFKSVYKKIKKNKKYFISIKDIIVLDSLVADGIVLPDDLKYETLSAELTVPKNLKELVSQNQIGLLMLKMVEIIGEDSINDLDPETIYFLTKILNELNLKKIRNNILSEALPQKV